MLSTSSKELGTRHQTPTLIGCIFLKTPQNKPDLNLLYFANLAAISEALNSSTVFEELSKLFSLHAVLATPATCSNHLHRAKPCILYRFLTHSEHKTKLSSPTFQAIYSSTQTPPQTTQRTRTLLQSGLSSEALDYSTVRLARKKKSNTPLFQELLRTQAVVTFEGLVDPGIARKELDGVVWRKR